MKNIIFVRVISKYMLKDRYFKKISNVIFRQIIWFLRIICNLWNYVIRNSSSVITIQNLRSVDESTEHVITSSLFLLSFIISIDH